MKRSFLSPHQAAERIGITIREMMKLIRKGIVPAAKVSTKHYLIEEAELDTAINNLKRKQTEERIINSNPIKNSSKSHDGEKRNKKTYRRPSARFLKAQASVANIIKNAPSWDELCVSNKQKNSCQ